MADDDVTLVVRARGGDGAAFGALAERHRKALERIVRRYVNDTEDARDLVQTVCLRAFERLAQLRDHASFRPWITRMAVHAALSQRRAQRPPAEAPGDDVWLWRSTWELSREAREQLAMLPTKQRLAVELRLFADLSFDEIGAIVRCSGASARVNYHYGVRALRASCGRG